MFYRIKSMYSGKLIADDIAYYDEAVELVKSFEAEDLKADIYDKDYYEISEVHIYARGDRAIFVEDGIIMNAAGFKNVLCCEPEEFIKTEELEETDRVDFEWRY